VEWSDEFWFIEVKDPSDPNIPEQYHEQKQIEFVENIRNEKLFAGDLGPKIKDSFLYLHLRGELPSKPIKYFVIIALDVLAPALLTFANDALKIYSCLLGPDNSVWRNQYLDAVAVFNEITWNRYLPQCPVRRI
jgi:hypothetical protein